MVTQEQRSKSYDFPCEAPFSEIYIHYSSPLVLRVVSEDQYSHRTDAKDHANLDWLCRVSPYDLYPKTNPPTLSKLKPYLKELIVKYCRGVWCFDSCACSSWKGPRNACSEGRLMTRVISSACSLRTARAEPGSLLRQLF